MARHAVLFGLNYQKNPFKGIGPLRGSFEDVKMMKELLSGNDFHFDDIRSFTDDENDKARDGTTYDGIITELRALAQRSVDLKLEVAWIHFSGIGTQSYDTSWDERDWYDECIVPSDFERYIKQGYLKDDRIRQVLRTFDPLTKVVCVFDCNASATIGDLKYKFMDNGALAVQRQHNMDACEAKVILIGACRDDASASEVGNKTKVEEMTSGEKSETYHGALTKALVTNIQKWGGDPSRIGIHKLMNLLRVQVDSDVMKLQIPQLSCSYFVEEDETLF